MRVTRSVLSSREGIVGRVGSGFIADRIGGVVIDLDTIKSALLESGVSWDDASRWSYAVIYGLVDDMLATAGRIAACFATQSIPASL